MLHIIICNDQTKDINNTNRIILLLPTINFEVLFLIGYVLSFTNLAVAMITIITKKMIISENIQPAAMVLINVRRLFSLEVSEEIIRIINKNFKQLFIVWTKNEVITMISLYNDFTWHCNGTKIVCYDCSIIFDLTCQD